MKSLRTNLKHENLPIILRWSFQNLNEHGGSAGVHVVYPRKIGNPTSKTNQAMFHA